MHSQALSPTVCQTSVGSSQVCGGQRKSMALVLMTLNSLKLNTGSLEPLTMNNLNDVLHFQDPLPDGVQSVQVPRL